MSSSFFNTGNQLLQEGKLEEAIAAYQKAIEGDSKFAWSHHYLGEALEKVGRSEEAIAAFRQAVAINPQSAWSLYKLGELSLQQGQFEEAVGYLRRAIETKADVPNFYLSLAKTLINLERWSEAEESLGQVIKFSSPKSQRSAPYLAEAYYHLGLAKSRQKQWSEAAECYRQSWKINPTVVDRCLGLGEALGKLERWSEAVECYRQGVSLFAESAGILLNLGRALEQLERWEEAVVEYRRAISCGCEGAEVHYRLGCVLSKLGRWQEAIVEYRLVLDISAEVVEGDSQFAGIYDYLGEALEKVGQKEEAIATFRQAVAINPQSARSLYKLGELLRRQGQFEEAVGYLRRAIEIKTDVPNFYLSLAETLVKLKQWLEAEEFLDEAIELFTASESQETIPELAEAYYYLGVAKSGQKQWSEAVECYRQSWEMNPVFVDCCLDLGEALGKLEGWEEAVECYRQGVSLFGDLAEILLNLGRALEQLERWEEAAVEYRRAIGCGCEGAEVHYRLGCVLSRLGLWQEAIAEYRLVLDISPQDVKPDSQFAQIYHYLGEALEKLGREEETIAAFRQAVAINPQSARSLYKLGELLRRQGQFEEAVGYLRGAIEIKTDVPNFYLSLAETLVKLEQWLEAEEFLDEAIEFFSVTASESQETIPELAEAFYYLGVAKSGQKRWSEAVECYRQSWEMNPVFVDCCLGLGEALGKLERWSEAVECYRQGVSLLGELAEILLNLGRALEQLERWEEAAVEYRRAIGCGCEGAEVHYRLGCVLSRLGLWQEAIAEYRLVLDISPQDESWHQLEDVLRGLEDVLNELEEKQKAVEKAQKEASALLEEQGNLSHLIYEPDSLVDKNANINAYFHLNPDVKQAVNGDLSGGLYHWHNYGCMEGRLLPGVRAFINRKVNPEKLGSKDFGVNFYGPYSAVSGLGTAARGYVKSLEKAHIPHKIIEDDLFKYNNDNLKEFRARTRIPHHDYLLSKPYRINILHYNADTIDRLLTIFPIEILDNSYNIGIWTWELPSFRADWFRYFGAVDEVWVPSNFVRDALASIAPVPVITMPHCIELDGKKAIYDRSYFGVPQGAFVFSYIFDVSSHVLRKNPFALVSAFQEAFGGNSKAVLMLKFHSGQHNPEAVKKLRSAAARSRNIKIFSRLFSEEELISFKSITDCFVSPHRSEGFGLNIAEAMYLGKPVIATDFSSNRDFMNPENSYPLRYKLTTVEQQSGPYLPDYVWAEPSVEHLAELMLEVFKNRKEAFYRGQKAAKVMRQQYSPEAIGNLMRQRIAELGLDDRKSTTAPVKWGISKEVMIFDPLMFVDEDQGSGQRILSMSSNPTISIIVPVYNIEAEYLIKCIESVKNQSYPFWEICLCDDRSTNSETIETLESYRGTDPRIKVHYLPKNLGIAGATNEAAKFSTGSFLAFLDNDDELDPDALMEVAETINNNPEVDYIYTDEDKIDFDGSYVDSYYKPDWSPEHLESVMYALHMIVIRKSMFYKLGGMRDKFSGTQDYDLALRATRNTNNIVHIPKILYHWRKIPGSASAQVDAKPKALIAAKEALRDHIKVRYQGNAEVVDGKLPGIFRVRHQIIGNPIVTLLITTNNSLVEVPGRGKLNLVDNFVRSILEKTDYPNYRILVVDNCNSSKEQIKKYKDYGVSLVNYTGPQKPFNFASKANFGFSQVNSELVVLLNDDMEVISSEWLSALVEFAQSPEIGAVGGKLLHADGSIQHVGVVAGVNNGSAHLYHGYPGDFIGYNGYTHVIRNYAILTGACLATRRSVIEEVGGFDEAFAIDYNDTDFCLSILESGYRNVYTPYCELYHFESVTAVRKSQNAKEVELFQTRWKKYLENDPYYNVNLSRSRMDFSLV